MTANQIFALASALALSLAACGPGEQGKLDRNLSSVFAGSKARELLNQCSRSVPGPVDGTWTPTREQIDELEAALERMLAEELRREPVPDVDIRDYFRRYGGLIVSGKRIIYIDATAAGGAIGVCDGGRRFFGAEYDPATRTLRNVRFNGH